MKKILSGILALTMIASLAGCGSTETKEKETTPVVQQETVTTESTDEEGKVLVAYFLWSGNTKAVAEEIQAQTGGDLFEITTVEPYTDDYNALLDVAQEELAQNLRPGLAETVENMEQYDTVFIGYPIWWGTAPMAIRSFLEAYDFSGKTVLPFSTSGSSGMGESIGDIEASAVGAVILEGLRIDDADAPNSGELVTAWLSESGIK